MSWNFDMNSGGSDKAEFTKFPVGVTKVRVIDNTPHVRWIHWLNQHKRSVNCPGKGCPICEIRRQQKANKEDYTYNMTRRFAINIFNYETGKVEIMEQGVGFFEDLRDLKDDAEDNGKTLQDMVIKVKRRGTGKDDTSYRLDLDGEAEGDVPTEGKVDLDEFLAPHDNEKILRLISGEAWDEVMRSNQEDDNEEEIEIK